VAGLVLAAAACASVPDLRFTGDDASVSGDAGPGVEDASADGHALDAGEDGSSAGEAGGSCPNTLPTNGVCCGSVPCFGDKCNTGQNCATCSLGCAGSLCCALMGQPVHCVDAAAACM
jgi:hypothetical protein